MAKNKNWKKHVIKKSKKEIEELIKEIMLSIIGLLISVCSFFLYFKLSSYTPIIVLICIIDVIYAYINAKLFVKSQEWEGVRGIMIFVFFLFYWTVLFGVLAFFYTNITKGGFVLDLLFYPIFLMPSFEIVILLLMLIASGM